MVQRFAGLTFLIALIATALSAPLAAGPRTARAAAVAQAEALLESGKPADFERALKFFAAARAAEPANAAAWYGEGSALLAARRTAEALPLLQRAVELAPGSPPYHRAYWRAIAALPDRTAAAKLAEIEADAAALLARKSDADALLQVTLQYYDLGEDARAGEHEARLLREFSGSTAAESARRLRPLRISQRHGPKWIDDPALRTEALAGWRAYLAAPHHGSPDLVRSAWLSLLVILKRDPGATDAQILEAIHGMEGLADNRFRADLVAAEALADRKLELDLALRLARRALRQLPAELAALKRQGVGPGDLEKFKVRYTGEAHDRLGWVLFARGQAAAAERELAAARAADPRSAAALYHLGRADEAAGRLDRALERYREGMFQATTEPNPNGAALAALYVRRHGSMAGHDEYVAAYAQGEAAARKASLLAERIAAPAPPPPFALKTLAGATVSSADLLGKVAVIHFWGVWCTWCLREMEDVQALARKYATDPQVRILTVDNDDNPDTVRKWMAERGYDFPVLLEDGWGPRSGVSGYPTTWFLDPQGKIAFAKRGWSDKLVEEFGWRIEALRQP